MAIKVNLSPRAAAPARARGRGVAISAPRIAVGGGLVAQILTGVLVLVLLVLGVMGYRASSAKGSLGKDITELKARNEALKAQLTELRQAEAAKADIQRRIEVISRVAKSQGVPLAALGGVLKAIPQGIWLTSFDMKPREVKVKVEATRASVAQSSETLARLEAKRQEVGAAPGPAAGAPATREVTQLEGYSIVIKGVAFNNFQIADFMENLRKVGLFSDVDFVVTTAQRLEQTRVVSFEVTASVKL